jgi:uncharacterized protein YcbX
MVLPASVGSTMNVSVARLSITPVKSTSLRHPSEVRVQSFGVEENRRFYIAQPDGRLFNNTKYGPLMRIRSEWTRDNGSEWLRLHFPDRSVAEGNPTLVGEGMETSFYGRPVSGHVVEGPFTAALTAFVGRSLRLVRTDHPGDGSDGFPVSIVSTESAKELARRSGSPAALDSRRFRMLVEVSGCDPHQEDSWVGRRIRLGEAIVEVARRVARCVITTLDPESGVKDLDTLKHIKEYRELENGGDIDFGVYADVVQAGSIHVGDQVEPR